MEQTSLLEVFIYCEPTLCELRSKIILFFFFIRFMLSFQFDLCVPTGFCCGTFCDLRIRDLRCLPLVQREQFIFSLVSHKTVATMTSAVNPFVSVCDREIHTSFHSSVSKVLKWTLSLQIEPSTLWLSLRIPVTDKEEFLETNFFWQKRTDSCTMAGSDWTCSLSIMHEWEVGRRNSLIFWEMHVHVCFLAES